MTTMPRTLLSSSNFLVPNWLPWALSYTSFLGKIYLYYMGSQTGFFYIPLTLLQWNGNFLVKVILTTCIIFKGDTIFIPVFLDILM